jgi:hypothetical protein
MFSKLINLLFNKNQIKMKEVTIETLLSLHTHYAYQDPKDSVRLAKLAARIDTLTDEIVGKEKVEEKKPEHKQEEKPNLVDKNTPDPKNGQHHQNQNKSGQQGGNNQRAEADKKAADDKKKGEEKATADKKAAEEKAAEKPAEVVNEALVDVRPFYPCNVLAKGAKLPRRIAIEAPKLFKAFTTEEEAKKANNAYPCVDELQLVLDDAWTMACQGKTNKEILEFVKAELKDYYPELKSDSDWYGKLVNPLFQAVGLIKKQFGYSVKDTRVMVERPMDKDMELTHDTSVSITPEVKKAADKVEETKKPEMKTTQEAGKKKEEPVVKDEEAQEEETEEESEELDLDIEDENEEVDTTEPPAVNKFAEFDEFETLVFDKILENAKLAASMKTEAEKNAAKVDGRNEVRNLIQSNFEGEEWTEDVEENWNPKLVKYHNAIISEIQANKAVWSKK